jgi:homoserine kinase type II
VLTEEQARQCLAEQWNLPRARLARLDGGMSSATWTVDDRWVLKAVPGPPGDLLPGGLAVARLLAAAGIASGPPRPTRDGALTARAGDSRLGLLARVPGTGLTGDSETERRLVGAALARVHQVLAGQTVPGTRPFHWVDPAAPHLSLRPWLRPAVTAAVTALEQQKPGRWTAGLSGPLLYDLASAVMYLGGPGPSAAMTEAYLAAGVVSRAEAAGGLTAMLRFRWAVQADYFAWRITASDLTGISGPQENEKGLEDARRVLLG